MFVPVSDYEGLYKINEIGEVRSVHRIYKDSIGRARTVNEHVVKPCVNKSGYKTLGLYKDGKRTTEYVHKLVYASFNHLTHEGISEIDIDHIDGNKLNCHLDNLEAVSHKENIHRKICRKNGLTIQKGNSYAENFHYFGQQNKFFKIRCRICGKPLLKSESGLCRICYDSYVRSSKKPNKQQFLIHLRKTLDIHDLSKIYDVEEHSVRRWLREYGIPSLTELKKNPELIEA